MCRQKNLCYVAAPAILQGTAYQQDAEFGQKLRGLHGQGRVSSQEDAARCLSGCLADDGADFFRGQFTAYRFYNASPYKPRQGNLPDAALLRIDEERSEYGCLRSGNIQDSSGRGASIRVILHIRICITGCFKKAGCDNTGRDCYDAHPQQGYENREQLSQDCHGVDISIAGGGECGYSPPESGERIFIYSRLSVMFCVIHHQGGRDHQNEYEEQRSKDQGGFPPEHRQDHGDRIQVAVDPEQAQDAGDPDQPEHDHARRDQSGQIEGQEGKQVNDSRRRDQEPQIGMGA